MFEHLADPEPPVPGPDARDAVGRRAHRLVRRERTLRAVAVVGAFVVLAGGGLVLARRPAGPANLDIADAPAATCCGSLAGNVRNDQGPARGIVVQLFTAAGLRVDPPGAPVPVGETVTDASGHYRFGSLDPGSYVVAFTDPSGKHQRQWAGGADRPGEARPVTVDGSGEATADALLERSPVYGIDGRVTEASVGFPVAAIAVRLFRDGDLVREAVTDASGSYALTGVPAGTYTLAFVDGGGPERAADAAFATAWYGGGATPVPFTFDGRADLTADVVLARAG